MSSVLRRHIPRWLPCLCDIRGARCSVVAMNVLSLRVTCARVLCMWGACLTLGRIVDPTGRILRIAGSCTRCGVRRMRLGIGIF